MIEHFLSIFCLFEISAHVLFKSFMLLYSYKSGKKIQLSQNFKRSSK